MMKSIFFMYSFLSIFSASGFSDKQNFSESKPDINVKGRFAGDDIYNITIQKLYKKIPVYNLPLEGDDKPEDRVTYINLVPMEGSSYVKSIELVKNSKNEASFQEINKKKYYIVKIEFYDKSIFSRIYLMEENTTIYFNQNPGGNKIEIKIRGLNQPLYIESFEEQK